MSVAQICGDLRWYSDKTFGATEGIDKVCKLVMPVMTLTNIGIGIATILEYGESLSKVPQYYYEPLSNAISSIEPFTKLMGALGLFTFVGKWVIKNDKGRYEWQDARIQKIFSNACMTASKAIEMASFLNNLRIIELGSIAAKKTIEFGLAPAGKIVLMPLDIAKNVFVIASAGFNIWEMAKEKESIGVKITQAGGHVNKWMARQSVEGSVEINRLREKLNARSFDSVNDGVIVPRLNVFQKDKTEILLRAMEASDSTTALERLVPVSAGLRARATPNSTHPLSADETKILQTCDKYIKYLTANPDKTMAEAYQLNINGKVIRWTEIKEREQRRGGWTEWKANWTTVHEVSKIVICVISTIGTILAFSSIGAVAIPFLIGTTLLGLTVAALDYNKFRLDAKIKDLFDTADFKLPSKIVTNLSAAAA